MTYPDVPFSDDVKTGAIVFALMVLAVVFCLIG